MMIRIPFHALVVVGDTFVTEGTTNAKFPRELRIPGYVDPLVILGTGTYHCLCHYEPKFGVLFSSALHKH
jgi:hypothetical protein